MSDDVALAAAWRARLAAGYSGPVEVIRETDGWRVRKGGIRQGSMRAKYQAHAWAEQLARADASVPPGEPSARQPASEPGEAP